jgi:hypothetical protein
MIHARGTGANIYSFRVKIAVIARRFLPKQSFNFQRIASLACGTCAFGAMAGAEKRSQEQSFVHVTARSIATKQSPSTAQADCFAEFTPL